MRLIVCSSIFPNPAEPTKGIYVFNTVRAMADQADVAVLAPIPYFPKAVPIAQYARYAGIPAEAVTGGVHVRYPRVMVTPKVGRSLYGFSYAAGLYRPMARLVREGRPAALAAYWAYPDGFATVLLAKIFKLPVFVGALGCDVNDLDAHLGKRRMVKWLFRNCDGALAVSRSLGVAIVNLGVDPRKVAVIPNGLDDAFLAQAREGPDAAPGTPGGPTILYCGRLSAEKDPLSLMEAARRLFGNRPEAKLVFVGDGPLKTKIQELAAAWHIADRIDLVGEVPHDAIARYMKQADVLCLPSLTEGHPNVLLEALACGLPVVATNVGGVPEIITSDRLGILVPASRPVELAQALDAALHRRWDRRALREAGAGRSWRDVARETLDFMGRTPR